VKVLADTHALVWAAADPDRLAPAARDLLTDPHADTWFSVVSLWEVVMKAGRRPGFAMNADDLRWGLLQRGFHELEVTAPHVLEVGRLPALHGDPFDRLLVAQARVEELTIMTADRAITAYPVASMPA
jgi:PIN domain nuclease of toxin-antitoxin system